MAAQYLTIDVSTWSTAEVVALLERCRAAAAPPSAIGQQAPGDRIRARAGDLSYSEGWTEEALLAAVDRLEEGGLDDQLAVLAAAVCSKDGWVRRETADELTGRANLRGFTKPLVRVRTSLIAGDVLPVDAGALMKGLYKKAATGYSRAIGFQAPISDPAAED